MKLISAFLVLAAIGSAQMFPPCPPICPDKRGETQKPVKKQIAPKPKH